LKYLNKSQTPILITNSKEKGVFKVKPFKLECKLMIMNYFQTQVQPKAHDNYISQKSQTTIIAKQVENYSNMKRKIMNNLQLKIY